MESNMQIKKVSDKLLKVDESLTIYKYDNGYLVEVSGKDFNDDWATAKLLVSSLDEVFELVKDIDDLERS